MGVMRDDLFHFVVMFSLLYGVFAFIAAWGFGDQMVEFGGIGVSLFTQFRYLFGEWELPGEGFSYVLGVYCILFFVMVFSLLLNFFLAIVIDSYSAVKDKVSECVIENSVFFDIGATFFYPVWA